MVTGKTLLETTVPGLQMVRSADPARSPAPNAFARRGWNDRPEGMGDAIPLFAMGERQLEPGDRIGEYRIDGVRSRGALWDELDATHVLLPRKVVVRVTAEAGLPPAGVRLLREACIVEALAHPGVPRLFNCGRLADRRPWIAGERVAGTPLAEAIGGGALVAVRVAALLRHVAAVLDHAHGRGVVHRQIRPETIVLTDGERGWPVCVVDWSEARALDAVPAPRLTGPHDAPEIAHGGHYDGKVDVYALGVVAFEALTGTQLFHGAAAPAPVADRLMRDLRMRGDESAASGQLAWLVDDMLAADPSERPSAAEVVASAAAIAAVLEAEAETAALGELQAERDAVPTELASAADTDAVDVAVDDFATEAPTMFRLARASTERDAELGPEPEPEARARTRARAPHRRRLRAGARAPGARTDPRAGPRRRRARQDPHRALDAAVPGPRHAARRRDRQRRDPPQAAPASAPEPLGRHARVLTFTTRGTAGRGRSRRASPTAGRRRPCW